MRHLDEDDLTLLYYDELPLEEARSAREHLAGCQACRQKRDELLNLFELVDASAVPELPGGYEADVWRRLRPALRAARQKPGAGPSKRLRALLVPPTGPMWAAVGAAAALVIVAFLAGRFWPAAQPPAVPRQADAQPADLRERILFAALEDHFERTEVVLVELSSTDPSAPVDISGEQRRAADLLSATRLYRRAADEAGDRTVAEVLDALARVLTEVTVSPARLSAYELQALQRRIEDQQLLFKLRVAESSLRQRETDRRPAPRGSAGV